MNWLTHQLNNDPTIAEQVRQRHRQAIQQLEELGFRPLCTYAEVVVPFSLFLLTPIYWMMRMNREVVQVGDWLRIVTYYPLMVSDEQGVIALISGLGVKFYSALANDSALITANTGARSVINDVRHGYYKQNGPGSVQSTWEQHLESLARWQALGFPHRHLNSYEQYVALSEREEAREKREVFGVVTVWLLVTLGPLLAALNQLWRLLRPLIFPPQ